MNEYNEFDSISDDVLQLGSGLYLRMVVKLGKKDKDGNRDYFHKEYRYGSKYNDQQYSRTIKRSFDYFLLLEKKKYSDDDVDCYIQIRPSNMIILNGMLSNTTKWLFDNNLFKIRNGKLSVSRTEKMVKVQGLPLNNWIGVEPVAVYYENSNTYDKGVRIYLSSESKYIDISGTNYLALVYTLNCFDMYGTATNLLNYLQRPEVGTNLVTFENDNINTEYNDGVYSKSNRKIPSQKKTSFFDKIDEL